MLAGGRTLMALPIEDTGLRQAALAYVIALYEELTAENGAPTLGTQNQAVDFILADADLRQAAAAWAARAAIAEASIAPPQRPPQDALYRRVRAYLESIMEPPVFEMPTHSGA
jgi:hypothetical protein